MTILLLLLAQIEGPDLKAILQWCVVAVLVSITAGICLTILGTALKTLLAHKPQERADADASTPDTGIGRTSDIARGRPTQD